MKVPTGRWLEHLVIIGGIAVLWPFILGHRSRAYLALCLALLAALIILAAIRLRRFNQELDAQKKALQAAKGRSPNGHPPR